MSRKFTKEIELTDLFCAFLDKQNCQYRQELRRKSYHNEGYIDLVIKIGSIFIAVESKLNDFQGVFSQAAGNRLFCDYSYILYPIYSKSKKIKDLRKCGIGLIYFDDKSDTFKIPISSKKSKLCDPYYKAFIARNWEENRSGRILHESEIPEDYPSSKRTGLEPTYEWVNRTNNN